jgi:ABC-2 type transport system permease protein
MIRAVMLKGAGLDGVAQPLAALTVFAVVLTGAALLRFRRTLD